MTFKVKDGISIAGSTFIDSSRNVTLGTGAFTGGVTIDSGNTALHAGNYTNYVANGALTLGVSGIGLSGSASFSANQSGSATFTVTSNATSNNTASTIVARDSTGNFSAGTITASLSGNATSSTTAGSITGQANSATITATSANTANQIVLRDGSGNFSAGTITAALSGNASTATNVAWSGITSKPTTLSGFGITDAPQVVYGDSGSHNLDTVGSSAHAQIRFSTGVWGGTNPYPGNYSHVISFNASTANSNRTVQLYMGDVPGAIWWRMNQGGTQHPWEKILTSNNYSTYALPLAGGTLTGNITVNSQLINVGNSGSNTGLSVYHGGASGDYAALRFYEAGNNNQTIHVFPTTWQGGTLASTATGSINIAGANGVTFGPWNNISGYLNNSGDFWTKNSISAPIFYDSADPTYYINPAGNGTRAAYLNGNLWINPKSESYGEGISFLMPSQGTWGGIRWTRSTSNFTGAWALGYFGNETNNDFGLHNGTNGWRIDHSFNMTSVGSVRSPIFYDSNDTNYYFDPRDGSRQSRFLTISGGTTGVYGNELVVGSTAVQYSLQDTNLRSIIQAHGPYPVLSLNHTITSNTSHGPTVQFTANGVGNQFVIGMNGTGTRLDIGTATGNNWNPHNGIDNYLGVTGWRMDTSGIVYHYVSSRAPIFYDSENSNYFCDPNSLSVLNQITIQAQGSGNTNPITFYDSYKFIKTESWWMLIGAHANEGVKFRSSNGLDTFYINHGTTNYDAWFRGNVTAYSDERVKSDWTPVCLNFVEKLAQIKSGIYTRIDTGERNVGVTAQSLQTLMPEAVTQDLQGMLAVTYGNAAMVATVELAKYALKLEQTTKDLASRIEALEKLLNK